MTVQSAPIRRLRHVGLAEGVSFLVLLFVAMPLKYLAGLPEAVFVVGSIHGALFVVYVLTIAYTRYRVRWTWGRTFVALAASVVPFGPFLLDPSLRREQAALDAV